MSRAVGWLAFSVLVTIYSATLAPSVTWWDSGELIAAVHSLGVPHPPGTPLYVIVGNVWAMLVVPFDYAVRVNLLSAVATAAAAALAGALLARRARDPIAGFAAAVCAGAAASVWRNANEAEVYALALLAAVLILWTADRAGSEQEPGAAWRWILLIAYACGLAYAVHLAALVAVPAALVLIARVPKRVGLTSVAQLAGALLLGASIVLFMIVRAQHDPWVNQGDPATLAALVDVLGREQYADAGFWTRQAPLYLQIGNWFEYADWQWALGLNPAPPPSPGRTLVTLLFVVLALFGSAAHRALDRRSWRALAVLFATASIGVILYLNLKAGPSYGAGVLPDNAPREARERDYFFATSFLVWGLWAGFGAVHLARRVGRAFSTRARALQVLTAAGMAVAGLPIALNWAAVDRSSGSDSRAPIESARRILGSVPRGGVLLAAGDNDTYPVWYAQRVEGFRRDVTGVTIPLLGTQWYRAELARRHGLLDDGFVASWRGVPATVGEVCRRARAAGRGVTLTVYAARLTLPPTCDTGKR